MPHRRSIAAVALLLLCLLALVAPPRVQAEPPDDEAHTALREESAAKSPAKAESNDDPDQTPGNRETPPERAPRADQSQPQPGAAAKGNADDKKDDANNKKSNADGKKGDDKPDEKPVVTHGQVTIDGREIAYTATAGKMVMKSDEGDPKAHVFYIAYTVDGDGTAERTDRDAASAADADDVPAPNPRPVTFVFNGGPGSSSVWLHLGMLGPVRVKLGSDAETLPPPHELIPNQYSLLDVTDLVFIDPVSTGFSRPAKGEDKRQFHGYDEDLRSVGQFIHDYATKYGRWASPKFLLGESYGGLRAAGLSGELQERYHMYLNGIVLVSAVVDFQTLVAAGSNDVAYALFLPGYAATAWYHDALADKLQELSLEEVVERAQRFAMGPYLRALAAGDSLDDDRRTEIVQRMAELTGLSEEYVEASNLRVPMHRFGKELLRDRGLVVGRFDSRYTNHALDRVGDSTEYDPSASAVFGTFTSALNDYLRSTLKVKEDRVYEILTDRVHPWDYSEFANRFVNASGALRQAMVDNPFLKVFAACGYYDLATPAAAMEYTRDHLNLPAELRDNFVTDFYEGGHMMYSHEPSLEKLRDDLVEFYRSALEPLEPAQRAEESDD